MTLARPSEEKVPASLLPASVSMSCTHLNHKSHAWNKHAYNSRVTPALLHTKYIFILSGPII